jgi:hypothetical protein
MLWSSRGVPEHIRSDNGPEFVAKDLRKSLAAIGAKTLYIEPGSPWENGYCESLNSKLRDEFLNGEIFYSVKEVQLLAERWRVRYNTIRPHSSLGYRPPDPEAWRLESKLGFPLPQIPDGDEITKPLVALHYRSNWYKTSGRPLRISWLMLARNAFFAWLPASAALVRSRSLFMSFIIRYR